MILTGGDPLVLSPRRLGAITRALAAIPHVRVVRFHTRVPVVDPDRITPALIAAMEGHAGAEADGAKGGVIPGDGEAVGKGIQSRSALPLDPLPLRSAPAGDDTRGVRGERQVEDRGAEQPASPSRRSGGPATWVVVHANHPDELTPAARAALARIARAGIPMLSQSVLLRGVNDDPAVLERLFRGLVENRVKPYYLHHGDLAPGTSHFRTTLAEGQALMRTLRGRVSGLCQPDYVLDIPGGHGKSPVGPAYLAETPEGASVEDWRGETHPYPPGARA